MRRLSPLLSVGLLLLGVTSAAGWAAGPSGIEHVVLQTDEGAITVALDLVRAPATSANFLRYVDDRRFDGTTFYRALDHGEGAGLIQGGVRGDPAKRLPPIPHESTERTGLRHDRGALSMARHEPGSAAGDFFITTARFESLDAQPGEPGDNQGFAVFGRVVAGMDVVARILASPRSDVAGEGVMRGQMLAPAIRIMRAHRQ